MYQIFAMVQVLEVAEVIGLLVVKDDCCQAVCDRGPGSKGVDQAPRTWNSPREDEL